MIIDNTSAGPAAVDAATPVKTKMPVPMIDPIPSAVRLSGPSDRRRRLRSDSSLSSASDLRVKSDTAGMAGGEVASSGDLYTTDTSPSFAPTPFDAFEFRE